MHITTGTAGNKACIASAVQKQHGLFFSFQALAPDLPLSTDSGQERFPFLVLPADPQLIPAEEVFPQIWFSVYKYIFSRLSSD